MIPTLAKFMDFVQKPLISPKLWISAKTMAFERNYSFQQNFHFCLSLQQGNIKMPTKVELNSYALIYGLESVD